MKGVNCKLCELYLNNAIIRKKSLWDNQKSKLSIHWEVNRNKQQ